MSLYFNELCNVEEMLARDVMYYSNDNIDLGLSVLFYRYTEKKDMESGRMLAIECTKHSDKAMACAYRLWLMNSDVSDLGIISTLIGHIESDIVINKGVPDFLSGSVINFLNKATQHPEISVRNDAAELLLWFTNTKQE